MANYSPYSAGTAHLDIEPRFVDDFARRIKQEAKKHKAEIDVKADFREFERDLQRQLRRRQAEFKIRVTPDMDNFRRIMRQETRSGREVEVAIDLDTTRAEATLRAFTRSRKMFIDVDVNTTSAVSKLDMLRRMADDIDLGVNVDTAGARRNVANFRQSMANEMTSVGMSLAGTAAKTAAITSLFPAAASTVGVLTTSVVGLTGAAGGLIGQIGGLGTMLLGTFLPAMIATRTGMEGIKTAAQSIESEFTGMKEAVSDTFEEGFLPIFEQLGPLLTGLTPGLQAVAVGMTQLAGAAADVVTSNDGFQNLQVILAGSAEALARFAPGVASLTDAILNMGAQAAPVMGNFGAVFGGMFADIGDALNRLTTADFSNVVDFTAALGRSVSLLIEGFVTLGKNVGPAVTDMFNDLNRTFDGAGETLSRFGIDAANFIGDFIVATGPFMDQFSVMAEAATRVFGGALREIGPVLGDLINGLGTNLLPVLEDLGTGLASFGEVILTTMGAVGTISGSLLDPFIAGLDALKSALASDLGQASLDALATGFQRLTQGASDFLPPFIEALTSFGQPAMAAFGDVLGVVGGILTGLTPVMQAIADTMNFMQPVISALAAGFIALKVVPAIIGGITTAVGVMGTRLGLATVSMAGFRTAVANAGGGIGGFANTLRTGAVGALGAVRTSARNLMDLLGGPWGVAFAAAAAAVGAGMQANNRLKDSQEQLRESSQDLAMAQKSMWDSMGDAASVGDAIVDQIEAVKAAQDAAMAGEQRGFGAVMSRIGQDFVQGAQVWRADAYSGSHARVEQDQANALHDAAERAKADLTELQMTNEDLRAAIEGSDPDWAQFVARLGETSNGGADALNDLGPLRDSFIEMQGDAARLGPEFLSLGDAIDVLSDSSSTAEERISAVRRALQDMGLIPRDSVQLMFDFAESMDRIGESASKIGQIPDLGALLLENGQLDPFNKQANMLNGTLQQLGDEFLRVATNGGDTVAASARIEQALQDISAATGAPIEGLRELAGQAGYLPRDIEMLLSLKGSDKAQQDLTNLLAASVKVGEPKTVTIESDQAVAALQNMEGVLLRVTDASKNEYEIILEDEDAKGRLRGMIDMLGELENVPKDAKLDLDTSAFEANLEGAMGSLGMLTDGVALPTADLDAAPLQTSVDESVASLLTLGDQRPTPVADLFTGPLDEKFTGAMGSLGILAGQVPLPMADLEISPLIGRATQAMGSLDQVNNKRPRPVADANIDPLLSNVTRGQQAIDGMRGKEVTVKFKAVYEGFGGLGGISTSGGSAPAGGLPGLPTLASGGQHPGYRLPKTGPGTETVDGFMAFDRNMAPSARLDAGEWVINGDSSEKYHNELRAINAGVFPKLPGYANGGLSAPELVSRARQIEGQPYVFGGWNSGWATDCTGAASILANLATTGEMFTKGRFATANAEQALPGTFGFQRGRWRPGSLGVGFTNDPGGPGGGHAASTLPDGTNVEMGGARGNGQFAGRALGANDASFRQQWVLPMFRWAADQINGLEAFDLASILGSGGGGGGDRSLGGSGTSSSGSSSAYSSTGSKATPRSWSDLAGEVAQEAVSGQVSDALGIFGIPDQLPPFLQAWDMMNDRSEKGEPTAWEMSQSAATVAQLEAQLKVQSEMVRAFGDGITAVNTSPLGNANIVESLGADIQMEQMRRDLLGTEMALEAARENHRMMAQTRIALLGEDGTGAGPTAKDQIAVQRADNKVATLKEQINRTEDTLGEAKGEAGRPDIDGRAKTDKQRAADRDRVVAAEDKLAKLRRDLDIAEQEADMAKEQFSALSMSGFPDSLERETRISYNPAGGAEQWRPMVIAALNNQGLGSWANDPAIVDRFIRQINTESKGDPNIAQQIVDVNGTGEAAGVGLGQIIPGTWAAYRDPSLPDDRRDPWAHLNAMTRYVSQKYGPQGYMNIGNGIGYSGGGEVFGPGGSISDLIHARLSHGEFVVREASAQNHLPLLKAINGDANFMQNLVRSVPVSTVSRQAAQAGATDNSFNLSIVTQDVDAAYAKFNTFNRQRTLSKLG